MDSLLYGFSACLTPTNLLYCVLGVLLSTIVGVLPGIGPWGHHHSAADHVRYGTRVGHHHAGRHLLRRDVRRLHHLDPGQHPWRSGLGG
jgi:hypothetical protein